MKMILEEISLILPWITQEILKAVNSAVSRLRNGTGGGS
jgi:hypothetical protein